MKIYFDGGCRPNPGAMETAVVARGVTYLQTALGIGSNTEAEWLALIHAVRVAVDLGERDIQLLGDSAGVIGQARGTLRCRAPELQRHSETFALLAAGLGRLRIRQIARSQNLAGIALERTHGRV